MSRKKVADMTEEEREREREGARKRWANMTEEERKRQREYKRDWRASLTEEHKERVLKSRVLSAMKDRAKRKDLPFNLTFDHINEIWPDGNKCPVFGIPFVRGRGKAIPTSPSIDRIEPDKGYTIGNVQVISTRANRIKSDATAAEVMIVAQYLLKQERERE